MAPPWGTQCPTTQLHGLARDTLAEFPDEA